MNVLSWDKPQKKMPDSEWIKISADGAPPGVYTPNMSYTDSLKWKAKHIKGKDERVEIRKSFHFTNNRPYPNNNNYASQTVIIVRRDYANEPQVLISTNGKMGMTFQEFFDMNQVVNEALQVLLKK